MHVRRGDTDPGGAVRLGSPYMCAIRPVSVIWGWLEVSCWVLVQVVGQSILDDVESLLAEAGYAVKHFLDGLGAVAYPGVQFFDDSEWVAGSV